MSRRGKSNKANIYRRLSAFSGVTNNHFNSKNDKKKPEKRTYVNIDNRSGYGALMMLICFKLRVQLPLSIKN